MFGRHRDFIESAHSETSIRASASTAATSVDTERRIHHRWLFLTYASCSITSKDDFEEAFSDTLQRNDLTIAKYYGCREHHKTEGIHYHVLVNLGRQPNWSMKYARGVFTVESNECHSLHISTPWKKQRLTEFKQKHVSYCEKVDGGDCFGQRPTMTAEKSMERKRHYEEITSQTSGRAKLAKLKELFPDAFYESSDANN
ncbi:hypothetical protein N7541_004892 [Penicillium brevicompactum]|uniref:Geminivirus AL1 replication-associated protein catalytic domain-containing protein n=1 Tax=Penicillium brevicompactum TaxID=5074 RepID=A0A9W9REB7_PENBR|nr:hypothetical protein N7541_004892 [Penicillium brevicompactum]